MLIFVTIILTSGLYLTQASPVVPLASQRDAKYFWYPLEDGTVLLAFLEGSPQTKANEANIHFHLYTLNNQEPYELIIDDESNLNESGYIPNAPLKLLCHGFGAGMDTGPGPSWKKAYFEGGFDYNIVVLDWAKLATSPWYDQAAANTKLVGQKTAALVNYLISKGVTSLDQVHFIGHSLGAHVGGFLGSTIGAGQVGRITGLDPALPLFGVANDTGRIDPTDGAFVDIIHTSGGTLLEGGLAFKEERGHIDFYPNKGSHQPGCGLDTFGSCSHGRGSHYMVESINNPGGFLAYKCEDWDQFIAGNCTTNETAHMSHHVDQTKRGRFYLHTNPKSPYSQS